MPKKLTLQDHITKLKELITQYDISEAQQRCIIGNYILKHFFKDDAKGYLSNTVKCDGNTSLNKIYKQLESEGALYYKGRSWFFDNIKIAALCSVFHDDTFFMALSYTHKRHLLLLCKFKDFGIVFEKVFMEAEAFAMRHDHKEINSMEMKIVVSKILYANTNSDKCRVATIAAAFKEVDKMRKAGSTVNEYKKLLTRPPRPTLPKKETGNTGNTDNAENADLPEDTGVSIFAAFATIGQFVDAELDQSIIITAERKKVEELRMGVVRAIENLNAMLSTIDQRLKANQENP